LYDKARRFCKKKFIDILIRDIKKAVDRSDFKYWQAEFFMFVPKNWPSIKISGAQKRRKIQDKSFDKHLRLFWKERKVNILNFCENITEKMFVEEFHKFILDSVQEFQRTLDMPYKEFWTLMLKDNDFRARSRVCQIAVKIMRVENPSNVLAESIGRISNMIRDPKYSARMGNCTLDSRLILYKNTPLIEWWESHLANLCKIQIDWLGMYFSYPDSALPSCPKSRKTKNSYEKVFNFDPKKYKSRRSKNVGKTINRGRKLKLIKKQVLFGKFMKRDRTFPDL